MIKSINNSIFFSSMSFKANNSDLKDGDPFGEMSKFIENDSKNKDKKMTLKEKLLYYPSLTYIPILVPINYGIFRLVKKQFLKYNAKRSELSQEKLKTFKKSAPKNWLICGAATIATSFLMDFINRKNKDKNFAKAQKQVDNFNKNNGTEIKLIKKSKSMDSKKIAAAFKPLSGQIYLSDYVFGDIMNAKFTQTHVLNHELTHAKQHILMCNAKNGINKFNYLYVKKMVKNLDNEQSKKVIYNAYQEIKKDKSLYETVIKHDNYSIIIGDFITAIYKVIYERETNPNNIPIIINKEFYEKAKATRGQLTDEEEKKAQTYFEAYDRYSPRQNGTYVLSKENPNYNENLLEKEASNVPYKRSI